MPRGHEPWGTRYTGKAEVRKGLATRFEGLPDVHSSDDEHWVSGDRGVSQWTLTGTTKNGKKIRVRGCDLLQFRDGKIIRKDSYWKIVEEQFRNSAATLGQPSGYDLPECFPFVIVSVRWTLFPESRRCPTCPPRPSVESRPPVCMPAPVWQFLFNTGREPVSTVLL